MGDDDELRALRIFLQVVGVVADVGVVQRGLDLVEDAEGRGLELQRRKEDGDGGQRAPAAGEQRQQLQLLARGLGVDLDASVQRILRVPQEQLRLAAAHHARLFL